LRGADDNERKIGDRVEGMALNRVEGAVRKQVAQVGIDLADELE
jgi:hypothetical protein